MTEQECIHYLEYLLEKDKDKLLRIMAYLKAKILQEEARYQTIEAIKRASK
jgi:hypothetical protein